MDEVKSSKRAGCFGEIYEALCCKKSVSPLAAIRANLAANRLTFRCDRISLEDWPPILSGLVADRSLVEIDVRSRCRSKKIHEAIDTQEKLEEYRRSRATTSRGPIIYTNFLLRCFVDSVAVCARDSSRLTSLRLDGIPLGDGKYLDILSAGLAQNRNLQSLSFARCAIGDEGCRVLFSGIREAASLRIIDLTGCSLTSKSAGFVASFLKNKRIKLLAHIGNETRATSGKDAAVNHGLRTLVLDHNRKFGDDGLRLLAGTLKDDFWLKRLSVRDCGLTAAGGGAAIDLLEANSIIRVINCRRNRIPREIRRLIRRLLIKRRRKREKRTPVRGRIFGRKKNPKWRICAASRKKKAKSRRKIRRRSSRRKILLIGNRKSEIHVGNKPKILRQLSDRLSSVVDRNRNLSRGLAMERQLLASERLYRQSAERSYRLLRPAFGKLLRGLRTQNGIRGKVRLESELCANISEIFRRLEFVSGENAKDVGEPAGKDVAIGNNGEATVVESSIRRFDGKRRIAKGVHTRPHCPPR